MSQLQDRIAQFRKMANDDPDNELGHYRLGQLLMEAGQYDEAAQSFRRTLELSPQFSKVYQLLAQSLLQLGQRDEAVRVLRGGFQVADERGDNMPRDDMAKMLTQLGEPAPAPKKAAAPSGGAAGGFRCQRPGCMAGSRARQLPAPPVGLERALGQKVMATVCADCWSDWLRNMSIKVINELRLDLSTERGAEEYDRYMREYLGVES
ncbi:MAG TPA: tetratricopeptide repeat protein [Gemmataceae bacterium]|nr:tetratricopeptide repeat protein [Gemmataceae bacterium]